MFVTRYTRRTVSTLLLAVITAAILAPAANADPGGRRRYRPSQVETRRVYGGQRVVVRESGGAQVLAGFLGGLILGVAVSHAAPPPDYYYYDSYCDEEFATLEVYRAHVYHHHHPYVVRVIERDNGDCAYSYRYDQGAWRRCGNDYGYDDGYQGYRGNQGRYGCDTRYRDDRNWNNGDQRYRDDRNWNNGDQRYRDDRSWNNGDQRYRDNGEQRTRGRNDRYRGQRGRHEDRDGENGGRGDGDGERD